jgi:exo-poly-alpha-galacturonosidase
VLGLKDMFHTDIHFENVSFNDTKEAQIDYLTNSSFKNVTFDSSLKSPWNVTNSKEILFEK